MGTRTVNATFDETEHQKLTEIKGDRTWEKAILEEFGAEVDD